MLSRLCKQPSPIKPTTCTDGAYSVPKSNPISQPSNWPGTQACARCTSSPARVPRCPYGHHLGPACPSWLSRPSLAGVRVRVRGRRGRGPDGKSQGRVRGSGNSSEENRAVTWLRRSLRAGPALLLAVSVSSHQPARCNGSLQGRLSCTLVCCCGQAIDNHRARRRWRSVMRSNGIRQLGETIRWLALGLEMSSWFLDAECRIEALTY